MEWNIIFDPDFRIWFYQQEQGFQDETFAVLSVLAECGPTLGRPRVDTLEPTFRTQNCHTTIKWIYLVHKN